MSNGRAHRRRNRAHPGHRRPATVTDAELIQGARIACMVNGCTCDPWISVTARAPREYRLCCEHDDDCVLWIRRQAQWN